jgi:hypothetical protein
MQPFAFVVHTETMSDADHRAVDQHVAELFTRTLSTLGTTARRFRPNRRPARHAVLAPSHRRVSVER